MSQTNNLRLHKELWSRLYDYYKHTPPIAWATLDEAKQAMFSVMGIKHKPMYNSFLCQEYRDRFAPMYDDYKCGFCPLTRRWTENMCKYMKDIRHGIETKDVKTVLELIPKVRDIVDDRLK